MHFKQKFVCVCVSCPPVNPRYLLSIRPANTQTHTKAALLLATEEPENSPTLSQVPAGATPRPPVDKRGRCPEWRAPVTVAERSFCSSVATLIGPFTTRRGPPSTAEGPPHQLAAIMMQQLGGGGVMLHTHTWLCVERNRGRGPVENCVRRSVCVCSVSGSAL